MSKTLHILALLGCWISLWGGVRLQAQSLDLPDGLPDQPEEEGAGEVRVTYQTFYNRVNSATVANVSGAAVELRHFFPKTGLLSVRLEPLADQGGFAAGENFLQWKGLPWKGRHWDFALGDFRVDTALDSPAPFTNLIQPAFFLRGASVTARTSTWRYSLYGGLETLSQGQRIPFRERVPQSALGLEAAGKPWDRLKTGFRFLHLGSAPEEVAEQGLFFPLSRQFSRSDSLTAQASLQLTESLEWYTEAGWNSVSRLDSAGPRTAPFSLVSGPSWESVRFSGRASYVRQSAGYLPVLGYFLGDREGPNVDGVLRLGRVNLSGSWGRTRNNLERDPAAPDFSSRQASGGIGVRLPLDFSLNASVSKIDLETRSAEQPSHLNKNRQFNVTVSRALFRHSLRLSFQQLDIQLPDSSERQRFMELEDTYHWKRLTLGGAVRWQRFDAAQRKNSLFFRATAQLQLRRFSVYSYMEQGKDLANASLFATSAFSTSVVGVNWEAPRGMAVQVEAFRNNVNSGVNPESAFVLNNRGIPLDTTLARFNNWSLFVRASRQFGWGERLSIDPRGEVRRQAPITGMLAGFVKLQTTEGEYGAPDVIVVVDSGRQVKTNADGYFEIAEVPQGTHTVALNLDRLPAGFDPAGPTEISVVVRPEQATRAELVVLPLQDVTGTVTNANGQPAPESVVIRLLPAGDYTTTDRDGRFGFYNLPEGSYVVALEENTLPLHAGLVTPAEVPVEVRYGGASRREAHFVYEIVLPGPKPVQRVLLGGKQVVAPAEPVPPERLAPAKVLPAPAAGPAEKSAESENPKQPVAPVNTAQAKLPPVAGR